MRLPFASSTRFLTIVLGIATSFFFANCKEKETKKAHSIEITGKNEETSTRDSLIKQTLQAQKKISGKFTRCDACHSRIRPIALKAEPFETKSIYPNLDSELFNNGRAFPELTETFEFNALRSRNPVKQKNACIDCHNVHGNQTHGLSIAKRRENLGMWINLHRVDNILDVEVKFKSFHAPHRIPGGFPSRAYVIQVRVQDDSGKIIPLWFGPKLPLELRKKNHEAGLILARKFKNKRGMLTSDLTSATQFLDDTRLEKDRFLGEHFLYALKKDGHVKATAYLYYLRDFPSWKNAVEVMKERATIAVMLPKKD